MGEWRVDLANCLSLAILAACCWNYDDLFRKFWSFFHAAGSLSQKHSLQCSPVWMLKEESLYDMTVCFATCMCFNKEASARLYAGSH